MKNRFYNNSETPVSFEELEIGRFYTIEPKKNNAHCQLTEKNAEFCVFKRLMYAENMSIGTKQPNTVVNEMYFVLNTFINNVAKYVCYSNGYDYAQKIGIIY